MSTVINVNNCVPPVLTSSGVETFEPADLFRLMEKVGLQLAPAERSILKLSRSWNRVEGSPEVRRTRYRGGADQVGRLVPSRKLGLSRASFRP